MTLNAGMIVDTTNVTVLKLPVVHVFLVSAYYYPTSKSLGPNAVALNMVVDSKSLNIDNATYSVVGSNSTHRVISNAPSQVEGVPNCRYTTAMASTNTVSNLAKLEMESTGMTVEIPFKIARYSAPRPVIICISPQFVAEQWQIFMMQVHVSHRFGGHLHIYLTSIIDSYFELMKKYELLGFITIDYWLRMKFSKTETPFFEPNGNVEWRNQAGAQIDCLLQYKEAAEYIAFFDMDDILFPKTYPRYIEEFQAEWSVDPTTENFSEFNFPDLVTSLRSSSTVKRGKVVVRPDRYNSTWIHYSWHDLNSRIIASPNLIHVQRPTQKHGDNKMLIKWKMEFGPLNETIKSVDIAAIQKEIEKIRNSTIHPDITSRLPTSDFYLPIVFECYYKSFYGAAFDNQPGGFLCPNADSCELPQRENFKCIHSDAEYHSGPHMVPYTFHYAKKPFWSSSVGCYQ
ncbi:hypothetical protein GCK72_020492 [Caenorhabditis remanei]|uniref:Glycosyltransferase family 92 protein n=1 Tax=Caenorhabditis remanei TaxID=31234 RepID=A0A6A5GH91_CAERE|nr:hypothetical protein GCK72_020492 [Caenorhabditis remanei]KAF1753935.1 hypothetical protein GCK72_020492 [Caenorhabditis remanei]